MFLLSDGEGTSVRAAPGAVVPTATFNAITHASSACFCTNPVNISVQSIRSFIDNRDPGEDRTAKRAACVVFIDLIHSSRWMVFEL